MVQSRKATDFTEAEGRLREIKEPQSLEIFKRNIKTIKTFDHSCKLCKNFISDLGSL